MLKEKRLTEVANDMFLRAKPCRFTQIEAASFKFVGVCIVPGTPTIRFHPPTGLISFFLKVKQWENPLQFLYSIIKTKVTEYIYKKREREEKKRNIQKKASSLLELKNYQKPTKKLTH
jgi:hypothetical protein